MRWLSGRSIDGRRTRLAFCMERLTSGTISTILMAEAGRGAGIAVLPIDMLSGLLPFFCPGRTEQDGPVRPPTGWIFPGRIAFGNVFCYPVISLIPIESLSSEGLAHRELGFLRIAGLLDFFCGCCYPVPGVMIQVWGAMAIRGVSLANRGSICLWANGRRLGRVVFLFSRIAMRCRKDACLSPRNLL